MWMAHLVAEAEAAVEVRRADEAGTQRLTAIPTPALSKTTLTSGPRTTHKFHHLNSKCADAVEATAVAVTEETDSGVAVTVVEVPPPLLALEMLEMRDYHYIQGALGIP
jgi:hypothetical protein